MTGAAPLQPDTTDTTIEIAVRSTDMDADRNVNNAVFFQYFEQSRLEHLLRYGVIDWPPKPAGGAPQFALVQTSAQFRTPAVHRDVLLVTTRTAAIGGKSFTLSYEVRRRSDGALICEGSSVQVWLDSAGNGTALSDEVREALGRSLQTGGEEA
jgi:acyl-CoA thioester hydrolase